MSPPTAPSPPKLFKILLVGFPLGLAVLGAASFLIYFGKKDQAEQRSSLYAAGLRRDLNEADLARYQSIVGTSLAGPERAATLAAFIESTLGPENMGYTVRTVPYSAYADTLPGIPAAMPETRKALDVEVTGQKRRKELIVLVTDYLPATAPLPTVQPSGLPTLLGIAHACTGLVGARSLRLVAVPDLKGLAQWASDTRDRGDRLTHVALLGSLATLTDTALHEALGTANKGVVLLRPSYEGLEAAKALKQQLLDLAARQ